LPPRKISSPRDEPQRPSTPVFDKKIDESDTLEVEEKNEDDKLAIEQITADVKQLIIEK